MSTSADRINLYLQKEGIIAPTDDGVFGELADRASGSFVGMAAGVGSTLEKVGLGSGIKEYFEGVQERNQQWNAPEEQGIGGYIGGAIGSALGSTAGVLGASLIGSAVGGPGVGLAAGLTVGFAQSFGNNVQRNLDAGYSTDKAYGMAFLESGIDTVIENLPFGIVGKSGKVIAQAGRLNKITAAGKRELLNRIGKRIAEQVGASKTQSLLAAMGKSGLGEGTEEGLQFLNSYLNQKLGGDERANISLDEFVDNVAQGFIGGFFLGGIENTPMALSRIRGKANAVPVGDTNVAPIDNTNIVPAEQTVEEAPLFDTLVSEVGNALGIKIDFMDNLPNGQELMQDKNGMFDEASGTLYLNRQTYSVNPAETFGHELKHYIDAKDPALSKAFDALLESGKNDAARQEIAEIINSFKISDQEGNQEFSADMFGKLVARPETWQKMATYLDEKTPGMGEKFLQTLRDFYALVKTKLADMVGTNPEAETYLTNVTELQDEAARILAELRRRNGNSNQVENVVGAKGNTNVETVPVSAINVDAKRFQFKSNTNKASGVDESNKLGGDWDPRTAGNLYLWEDKNGKLYVVNGHHRLELAQRNGVENINAIIDRESDGVTAEQARRNGVLINIRDGQGEVRDYASFVRSEKLSEDEAKAQGVTARQKGRSGFLLGKAGDTLYEAYVNEVIPETKAVIIAEVANGNEAIEYAGIKLATDRKLAGETLRQTLKLAAQNTSGKKADTEQGGLFDMVDDSVLQEWEAIGKAAAKHIKEIRTRIDAAKDAIKNPEAAKSLGVKTSKGAEKLLAQAQEELARWENYATDPELMAQLREEAGIAPQEVVSETEKTPPAPEVKEEVVSAEKAQTILDKMRDSFARRGEILNSTSNQLLWTDIAIEYAEGQVLSKEADDSVLQEIIDMAKEDYQWSESRDVLYAISQNPAFSESIRKKAESAIKFIDKKIDAQILKQVKDSTAVVKENLTTETAEESSEVAHPKDATVDDFLLRFAPQINAIVAKNAIEARGNQYDSDMVSDAYIAAAKAYEAYDPTKGASLDTFASTYVTNAITDVNRSQFRDYKNSGGTVSLDQENEQGETLYEAVGEAIDETEQEYADDDFVHWSTDPEGAIKRILSAKLNKTEKTIAKLIHKKDLPPSKVIEKLGKHFGENKDEYMTREEYDLHIASIKDKAADAGVRWSRKRGVEEKPIVNMMPDVPANLDLTDTPNVKKYLKSLFSGSKFRIKSDGRLTAINSNGIEAAVKKRGISRQSLFDTQNIVENSYPVGYEYADVKHLDKSQNINGQFIYVSLIDINDKPFAAVVKLDDFANEQYAKFKDIAVKEITPAVRGSNGKNNLANPPVQVSDITVHQLVDFVKQHFKENKLFTENIADIFDKRLDDAYFAALERGDMQTAGAMVRNAEKRAGYSSDDSWRMSHRAPNSQDVAKDPDGPAQKITDWRKMMPKDYFEHPEYYIDMSNPAEREAFYHVKKMLDIYEQRKSEGNGKEKNVVIRLYRAVDKNANSKEDGFRNGDWVTPSRIYAEREGELNSGDYRIIAKAVPLENVYWNGDSIAEMGYDDGKSYTYADTKNFRKLQDVITYDDNGNVIPLSQRFNRKKEDIRYSRKRLHQQINPVVVNGFVRDEYQDLLDNKEYTPETLAKWGEQAKEWIIRNGGVVKAVELFLADKVPADGHVAAIARRMLLNSDVYADAIPYKDRVKLGEQEIDFRSEWGKIGRALQLNALKLDDIANVQALLNKLQENMPEEELKKLRNDIKDRTGVDIYELPDDIVEDKSRLDAVLRAHLAHKASFKDKAYEYWINAILSGPTTHFANFLGNTVHIGYELGLKRFVEAVTNTVAGRKNGASFGEFRQMMRSFNWSNAWKAAGIAFDQETLDLSNKFIENTNVAIGGKLGRAIRTPGRLLKAADALAKAIIEPMETAAYAYRIGTSRGYTGNELNSFVQEQLSNQNSQAYAWAKQRALEVTFQEEPGHFVRSLMAMREADGYVGTGLKLLLPFIKTPANILRQGIRKGPLGGLQVLKQTIDIVSGKRGFDDKYVSNVAEQIIAWTAIMSLYALSDDDDDLPIITGTSAPYGSAEYGYKANKIPPYSIRIGRSYWSYARLEPFATGLAAIADGMQAIRDAKNGKEGTAIIKDLVRSVKQSIVDKSFLESIGEINKALENPQNISRLGTNLAASAIPNVFRQLKQSFDENVQDTKSRERGMEFLKDQFFVVTNRAGITTALPKVDYFGRDVQKDDWGDTPLSFVGRLLPVKRIAPDENMDEVEKLIWNYNQKNPNDTYYPSIPQTRFVKNGTKMYFTGSNYREFAAAAGKLAHKQMLNAVKAGRLNVDNPDENDIKLIKKIFTRARKEVRERMSANAKKE